MARTKAKEKAETLPARWSPSPTPLEMVEGATYKARCADPTNAKLCAAHADAFNEMSGAPRSRFGTARCQNCCIYYLAVLPGQECRNCGHIRPPLNLSPLYPSPAPAPEPARPVYKSHAQYDEEGARISQRKPRQPRQPRPARQSYFEYVDECQVARSEKNA